MTEPDKTELHVRPSDDIASKLKEMRDQRKNTPDRMSSLHDNIVAIELFAFAKMRVDAASRKSGRAVDRVGIVNYSEARFDVKSLLDSKPQSAHFVPAKKDFNAHFDSAWNRLRQSVRP